MASKIYYFSEDKHRLMPIFRKLEELGLPRSVYSFHSADNSHSEFYKLPQVGTLVSKRELHRNALMWYTLFNNGGWFITKPVDPQTLYQLIQSEEKSRTRLFSDGKSILTSVVYSKAGAPFASVMSNFYLKSNFCIDPAKDLVRNLEYFGANLKAEEDFKDELGLFSITKADLSPKKGLTLKKSTVIDCSIIMPVFNVAPYIKECIDSILNQDTDYNYEVLIADDKSTDKTVEIIKSYQDPRIKLFESESHVGIVQNLNKLIEKATGRYLVRMDGDDVMLPSRIQHQVDLMDSVPDIDILGSGRIFMRDGKEQGNQGQFQPIHFLRGNIIIHPAVIMRADTCKSLRYPEGYPFSEDLALYHDAFLQHKVIVCEPTPVIKFREPVAKNAYKEKWQIWSSVQLASKFKNLVLNRVMSKPIEVPFLDKRSTSLTAIITFKNEGDEVLKTVKSIRDTTTDVNILLIDDASTDNYDYISVAEKYKCSLIRNKVNVGVASSRNIGVINCPTEYFVLLDGHMRFYNKDWDKELLKVLRENPNSIVTSNTVVMVRKEDGSIENDTEVAPSYKFETYGAVINPSEPAFELTARWTGKTSGEGPVVECAAVMGAVYASSKTWWNHIQGLNGLIQYGNDEALMSIKTWMLGGRCLIMRDWGVGHLYRTVKPYLDKPGAHQYNILFVVELFVDNISLKEKIYNEVKATTEGGMYKEVLNELCNHYPEIRKQREYINENKVMTIQEFLTNINSRYL